MHILVPVYVLLYTIIMRFMLLNLVLSVILDRFTDSATYEGLLSTDNFFDVSAPPAAPDLLLSSFRGLGCTLLRWVLFAQRVGCSTGFRDVGFQVRLVC